MESPPAEAPVSSRRSRKIGVASVLRADENDPDEQTGSPGQTQRRGRVLRDAEKTEMVECQRGDPPMVDPPMVHLSMADRCMVDPCIVDPCIVDPCIVDPCIVDPSIVDRRMVHPFIVEPSMVVLWCNAALLTGNPSVLKEIERIVRG
jgi:hypothetical protein